MLVDGGLWVIVGVWGSIGEVGISLLLGAEWLGVCGGLIIRTPAKIWAVSASCLAPAVMRALFRRALCELLLMNLARAYGRAGKWRWWKSKIGVFRGLLVRKKNEKCFFYGTWLRY